MFDFLGPFVVGLGGAPPSDFRLPTWLFYGFAWLTEMVWHAVHRWWEFEPYLLRCEVNKIGGVGAVAGRPRGFCRLPACSQRKGAPELG